MPETETEKYVTPDQMRDVVERINRGIPVDPASVISPTPPTPAKQAGFVRRTFFDDFDSLATIDTG